MAIVIGGPAKVWALRQIFCVDYLLYSPQRRYEFALKLYSAGDPALPIGYGGPYEVVGAGYAPILLDAAQYIVSDPYTPGGPYITYPEQTFTFTGLFGNVAGYFLTNSNGLFLAEAFTDGPYDVTGFGFQIKVTPKFTLQ